MNKLQIIQELEKAAKAAFHNADGSLNYHRLKAASGLTYYQIKNVFDANKQPTFDTILKLATAVNKKIIIE